MRHYLKSIAFDTSGKYYIGKIRNDVTFHMGMKNKETNYVNESVNLADVKQLVAHLRANADPKKAIILSRFFKTGPGEYGYGDTFLGVQMPILRDLVKKTDVCVSAIEKLVYAKEHEVRMTGWLFVIKYYKKNPDTWVEFFRTHMDKLSNWDFVDVVTPHVLGHYLLRRSRDELYILAKSPNLWHRRISMLATFPLIKKGEFEDALKLACVHLTDSHQLMHKAVGWMLREIGKKDEQVLLNFLNQNITRMPSIMRSYALERFPKAVQMEIRAKVQRKKSHPNHHL